MENIFNKLEEKGIELTPVEDEWEESKEMDIVSIQYSTNKGRNIELLFSCKHKSSFLPFMDVYDADSYVRGNYEDLEKVSLQTSVVTRFFDSTHDNPNWIDPMVVLSGREYIENFLDLAIDCFLNEFKYLAKTANKLEYCSQLISECIEELEWLGLKDYSEFFVNSAGFRISFTGEDSNKCWLTYNTLDEHVFVSCGNSENFLERELEGNETSEDLLLFIISVFNL